jgi:integrase/recombinase XerD
MKSLREKMKQQMLLKGYSERTMRNYIESIFLLSKYYNTSPDLLTIEQIRDYIQHCLVERKLSKSWLNQLISALKILFCEVLGREWNKLDIPRARRDKKLPVVFSRKEVERILNSPKNIKHRAFLMLTYSAGLRISEVCNIKVADIDSQRMLVRVVQAKGNKDRYSILSPIALIELRLYWKIYKPKNWLFEGYNHSRIANSTAQAIFKKALSKSGVTKKVSIHTLRHSFATHLMEQGVSMPIVQQLLGHKSLKTTSIYLHVQQYSINAVKSPLDTLSL